MHISLMHIMKILTVSVTAFLKTILQDHPLRIYYFTLSSGLHESRMEYGTQTTVESPIVFCSCL